MSQHVNNDNIQNTILCTNEQFLQAVFRQDMNRAHVTVFHEDPNNISGRAAWMGAHWGNLKGNFTQGGNQYYTISTFNNSPDGVARRRKDLFYKTYVVVIDDVGTGPSAKVDPLDPRILPPSFAIETSRDNCQYGYILSVPEANGSRVVNLLDGMVSAGIADGKDPGMKGLTRYVRLPEGTNNKQKYVEVLGHPFQCRALVWEPFKTFSLEELAAPFGIDLDAEVAGRDFIGDVESEGHPAYDAMVGLGMVKSKLGTNNFDVTCPWVEEHTDMDDSGTAVTLYPDGKCGLACHHGHGDEKRGMVHIMKWLYEHDPELKMKEIMYGFGPTTPSVPLAAPAPTSVGPSTIENGDTVPLNLHILCMGLAHDSDYNTAITPILNMISMLPMEGERDPYIQTVADQTGRRVHVLRNDVKRIIRARQRDMIADGREPEWVHTIPDSENPRSTLENFYALMNFYGIRDRYNEMTKSLEIQVPGEEFHTDTAKNAQILRMESLMIQHGMNPKQTVGWCNYAAQYDTYHPFKEYLESAGAWDGVDHIGTLANTLKVEPGKERLRNTLLKRWLVSVCAAAMRDTTLDADDTSESAPAPRGVLTLQGEQYMGKTRWFRRITPKTMFKEGLQLGSDKDSVKQATNALIVEIGEADTSTKKDVGMVKAFISRDYDELRVPWDKAESRWPRRTVFGGSVNPAKFLTDTTGNSRWWVVPVLDIDFALLSMVSVKQLWLQAEALWLTGEPYLLTDEEMAELNESNVESQVSTPFEDALNDLWCFDTMEGAEDRNNWKTLADITVKMKTYGVLVPRDTSTTKGILLRLTGHTYDRKRKWKLPEERRPEGS